MSRAKDCWLVMAGAGFQGTAVSPLSLVHLPPPLAECVVGGLRSGVKVSRDFSKEHMCVRLAGAGRVRWGHVWAISVSSMSSLQTVLS